MCPDGGTHYSKEEEMAIDPLSICYNYLLPSTFTQHTATRLPMVHEVTRERR